MARDGEYLWVNKDAATLWTNPEALAIRKFIQKDRKKVRLKRLNFIPRRPLSWRRRKYRAVTPGENDPGVLAPVRQHGAESVKSSEAPKESSPALTPYQNVCLSSSKDHLDPFLRTVGPLSLRDRNPLHYYLSEVPGAVYGTSKNALNRLVRDTTVVHVQTNPVCLQWSLLMAETYLRRSVAAESSPTILARTVYLYRKMYEMVTDPKTRFTDTAIISLTVGAYTDGRSGGLAKAQNHLKGVRCLIEEHGGTARLAERTGFQVLNSFVCMGLGVGVFGRTAALEDAIASFLRDMRGMQQWQPHVRKAVTWPYLAAADESCAREQQVLKRYTASRNRALGPLSALRPFLRTPFYEAGLRTHLRSHVALSWMLNKALWDLREDYTACTHLLDELSRYVEAGDDTHQRLMRCMTAADYPSPELEELVTLAGEPTLICAAVYHVFVNCTRNIRWEPETPSLISKWFEVVDVVELLLLLPEQSRWRVLSELSSWLVGDAHLARPEPMSAADLERVADEMRRAWCER
jgi:hypothetical protein